MPVAPGEPQHPALALVNSRRNGPDGAVDELATVAGLRAWTVTHALPPGEDADALAAMRDLRDAVRELLTARIEGRAPATAAVATINAASAAAPVAWRLTWERAAEPRAHREALGANAAAQTRALVAADAIDLVTGPDRDALLACGAPGCVRLLLRDPPRRHWCSTRCGDRVRASRYYHRHKA